MENEDDKKVLQAFHGVLKDFTYFDWKSFFNFLDGTSRVAPKYQWEDSDYKDKLKCLTIKLSATMKENENPVAVADDYMIVMPKSYSSAEIDEAAYKEKVKQKLIDAMKRNPDEDPYISLIHN